jgi:dihydrofolate reductase
MRKLIYWVHTSIDGHIEGPNGEFDWAQLGPELGAYGDSVHDQVDTFLYGRAVWDMMSSYWPHADTVSDDAHDIKFAPIWRATPKIVFSRTLREAAWNARVIGDDLAEQVAALKRQPGKDLLLNGGATTAAVLTGLGLIDDYQIIVHPVVLGGGKTVFPGIRANLRPAGSRTFDGRTTLLRYENQR